MSTMKKLEILKQKTLLKDEVIKIQLYSSENMIWNFFYQLETEKLLTRNYRLAAQYSS